MNAKHTLALTAAIFLASAPAALADTTATIKNGELFITDSPSLFDEPMEVTFERSGSQIKITDLAGDMHTDSTCTLSGAAVFCPSVPSARVEDGVKNDVIENLTDLDTTWVGNKGNDGFRGGSGNDVMGGGPGNDVMRGGAGRDVFRLEDGNDTFFGGLDRDTVNYDGASVGVDVTLDDSSAFNDGTASEPDRVFETENVIGSGNADTIVGNDDGNTISARAGSDVVEGEGGNDVIDGEGGGDTIRGDAGVDTVTYADRTAPVTVTLDGAPGDGEAGENDNIKSDVENLKGGSAGDHLTGSSVANTFLGDDGNDILNGSTGADTLDGGAGIDATSYENRVAGVTVTLESNGAADDGNALDGAGDIALNVENAKGSNGPDVLFGSVGVANVIKAGPGDDEVHIQDGEPDTADCGDGHDGLQFDLAFDTTTNCEFILP